MSKTDNGTSILTLHIAKALERDEGNVWTDPGPIFISYLFIDDE